MARVTIPIGGLTVEVETSSAKSIFKACNEFSILKEDKCGACGSGYVTPSYRKAQEYEFYSFRCNACRAELKLGQRKEDQSLFPKRLDENGNPLENNGWVVYRGQGNSSSGRGYQDNRRESAPVHNDDDVPF